MYTFLKLIFYILFRIVFRTHSEGQENVPKDGALLIAANHMSNVDPPLLASFAPRPISYMAKQELFDIPLFGQAIRACHAFPVKRGKGDSAAVKAAVKALKEGRCVGVFPEGTRNKDGKAHKAEAGIALLSAMTGAPVLPSAIVGTNQILSDGSIFPKLQVIYGKPLTFQGERGNREDLNAFSQEILSAIYALKQKAEA